MTAVLIPKADPRGRGGEPPVDRASLRSRLSRNQRITAESATVGLEGPAPINDCGGVDSDTQAVKPEVLAASASGCEISRGQYRKGISPEQSRCNSGPQSPATRAEARAAGLKFYFGQPCPRGHRRRYVSSHECVTCAAARHVGRVRVRPSQAKPRPPEVIAASLDEGRRLGTVKYYGRPHRCGATVRYVLNTKCVACQKARNVNNARLARLRTA